MQKHPNSAGQKKQKLDGGGGGGGGGGGVENPGQKLPTGML